MSSYKKTTLSTAPTIEKTTTSRHTKISKLASLICLGATLITTSCVTPTPAATSSQQSTYQNPYPAGTHENFQAREDYLKTSDNFQNPEVLARTNSSNSSIVISLSKQRAKLMNGNEVAIDYAVSTGTSSHPTPAGSYKVREMIQDKRSNIYGEILDASGNVVKGDAKMPRDKHLIPSGGKYLGAAMPYWMRLTWSGIGMHVGNVPRYPASHACIRGQSHIMPIIFSKVKIYTPVTIEE